MNETKTFRIALHLSHFFQDHRSMCRIFINKEMKCVSDLQDHIHKIFNINNFYLVSQGHYIPPTEDIRILQKDDTVVAIPNQYSFPNVAIYTSTPLPRNIMGSTIEKKRKRQIDKKDVESSRECLETCSKDNPEKKKKKKKINSEVVYKNEGKQTNTDFHHEENKHENIENDTIKTNNTEKKLKNLNIFTNMQNLRSEESNKNESNNSVKHLDEVTNCIEIQKQLYKSSKTNDANHSQNNLQTRELNNILSKENEDKQQFQHKKLLIQKRSEDIISYELPKKSNIVKSILISNKSLNTVNSNLRYFKANTAMKINKTLKVDEQMQNGIENSIKENNDELMDNIQEVLLNSDEVLKPIPTSENFVSNQIEAKSTETSEKVKIDNDIPMQNLQEVKIDTDFSSIRNTDDSKLNKIVYSLTSINTNKENIANINQNNKITEAENNQEIINNLQDSSLITEKCLQNNSVEYLNNSDKIISINSEISTQNNIFEIDSVLNNVSILPKAKSSVIQENLNNESRSQLNTFSDDVKCADAISFITRRKRKRSHRKRKSNANLNNNTKSAEINFIYNKQVSGSLATPVMHVKFDDNGEPIRTSVLQENAYEFSMEVPTKLIDNSETAITDGCQPDEPNNIPSLPEKVINGNNDDPVTIDSDSTEEKGNKLPNVISEDVILKSPLMTLTKPKVGDLIAFKILRLTEDYTPEVSKHIVGEILSISDATPETVIKVIDGLDQCTEPDGKFFIEDVSEKLGNIKSYCWTSLIEPRLIFP